MDSTMAWNWSPSSPSGLIGASSSIFLAVSVTDFYFSPRWRWICVTHAEILAWETVADAHRRRAAALLISSASVVDRSTSVPTELDSRDVIRRRAVVTERGKACSAAKLVPCSDSVSPVRGRGGRGEPNGEPWREAGQELFFFGLLPGTRPQGHEAPSVGS
ncbi:hypothetical protein CesoFtcFv8_022549 [Champsocephalus esox]|uniref:Uncharacterized protein n=1 Tax=Champsocephalus esox TaxID=159716 RepID=A0AAN8BBG3_9TELE|nr:hypothetical protein CesoFtcFv8_022549 [Champsocephalus esox]